MISGGQTDRLIGNQMMLKRHRVLLGVLLNAPHVPTRTELMKWAFLMREETPLSSEHSFYDFVPHKYGPFSFLVYRDLEELRRLGYLSDNTLAIRPPVAPQAASSFMSLASRYRGAVEYVLTRYGSLSRAQLVRVVYENYPWFASRSQLDPHSRRVPVGEPAIYTIGYEGKSIDCFMKCLLKASINRIIDVRMNAVSRKYGFAKVTLSRIGAALGIGYAHFPELGTSRQERHGLRTQEDYDGLLDRYEESVLPRVQESRREAAALMAESPSVLVCFESDSRYCHRGRLAQAISTDVGLEVVHL